jgi:hypothetical protein
MPLPQDFLTRVCCSSEHVLLVPSLLHWNKTRLLSSLAGCVTSVDPHGPHVSTVVEISPDGRSENRWHLSLELEEHQENEECSLQYSTLATDSVPQGRTCHASRVTCRRRRAPFPLRYLQLHLLTELQFSLCHQFLANSSLIPSNGPLIKYRYQTQKIEANVRLCT